MYSSAMDNVLSAMYAPNDKLGVELIGATRWNGLKRAISALSANAVKNAAGSSDAAINAAAINALYRSRLPRPFPRPSVMSGDPLCAELLGMNEAFSSELLGSLSDFGRQIKNLTHNVLEWGEDKPILSTAVQQVRDTIDVATGGKKVVDTASTIYDNRGKIILIAGGVGILLYFMLRKKR